MVLKTSAESSCHPVSSESTKIWFGRATQHTNSVSRDEFREGPPHRHGEDGEYGVRRGCLSASFAGCISRWPLWLRRQSSLHRRSRCLSDWPGWVLQLLQRPNPASLIEIFIPMKLLRASIPELP